MNTTPNTGKKLRHIEGASQRVQEDTMRFATILEDLGVELIKAVMVLVAFLPILFELSKHVPELPIVGEVKAFPSLGFYYLGYFWYGLVNGSGK